MKTIQIVNAPGKFFDGFMPGVVDVFQRLGIEASFVHMPQELVPDSDMILFICDYRYVEIFKQVLDSL